MSDKKVEAFLERYNRANPQVQHYCRLVPADMTEFDDADQWEDEDIIFNDAEDEDLVNLEFSEGVAINDMFHELSDAEKLQTGLKQIQCWLCEKVLYPQGRKIGAIGFSIDIVEEGNDRVLKTVSGLQCAACFVRYQLDMSHLKLMHE